MISTNGVDVVFETGERMPTPGTRTADMTLAEQVVYWRTIARRNEKRYQYLLSRNAFQVSGGVTAAVDRIVRMLRRTEQALQKTIEAELMAALREGADMAPEAESK